MASSSKARVALEEALQVEPGHGPDSQPNSIVLIPDQLHQVSLEDLHSLSMKMDRKHWGLKQRVQREAAKMVADWFAKQPDLKAAGLTLR